MQQNAGYDSPGVVDDGWGSVSVTSNVLGDGISAWLHNPNYNANTNPKADIVIHNTDNSWAVATSNGSSFPNGFTGLYSWGKGDWTGLADVTGDGKADIVTHDSGNWIVSRNDGTGHFNASGSGPWLYGWGAGDWAGSANVN